MSYLNSDNALALAKKLEEIPNVKQVRFHYVLRDHLKENFGENAVVYFCYVESLDQSNADKIGAVSHEKFMSVIEERAYEDVENHGHIQAMMNERIGHYFSTGSKIDNVSELGRFSYPYTVDADGNRIYYSMETNNPNRG
jgi:hypothetical protein